jgi:hypothetical protein
MLQFICKEKMYRKSLKLCKFANLRISDLRNLFEDRPPVSNTYAFFAMPF